MVSLWWKQSQQQLKLVGFQCNSARDESFGELKLNGKAHQSLRIWEKNSSNRLNECTTTSSHWFWGNSLGQNDGSWSLSHCVLATYFTHTEVSDVCSGGDRNGKYTPNSIRATSVNGRCVGWSTLEQQDWLLGRYLHKSWILVLLKDFLAAFSAH